MSHYAIGRNVLFGMVLAVITAPTALAAPAEAGRRDEAPQAESRIIQQGDIEILTFESEENYQKLQELYKESRKSKPKPGTFTMQFYRSKVDGSVQPYSLWLPRQYDDDEASAFLVQLHGAGPNPMEGRRLTFQGMEFNDWVDPNIPVIVAHPLGRTNNSYQVMGEMDVLEVMADVQERFNVDPDRVFLMGHSMGGGGTMSIGLHYPDRFGSLTPIDGAGGMRSAAAGAPETTPAAEAPAPPDWMAPQSATFEMANLIPNGRNLNIYVKDAGAGIRGSADSSLIDAFNAAGAFATREIFPGMPHHFAPIRSYSMFVAEAVQQPIPRNAPEVKFYTNNLRYNSAYWITIDQLVQHNADATLHAVYDDGAPAARQGGGARGAEAAETPAPRQPSIAIETSNIAGLTLRLAGAVAPNDAEAPVTVDGQTVLEGKLPEVAYLALSDGKWKTVDEPALAGKRHGMQGPISDAFMTPFLGVYGEGAGAKELAVAELDAVRAKGTYHGDFPLKSASNLTKDDIENYSLILFGGPEANSVVKRLAPSLPESLMAGPHDGGNGVVLIQPNPENPERYAVVWTARVMSLEESPLPEGVSARRLLPSFPDYLIVKDGKIVEGGHFGNDWALTKVSK